MLYVDKSGGISAQAPSEIITGGTIKIGLRAERKDHILTCRLLALEISQRRYQ